MFRVRAIDQSAFMFTLLAYAGFTQVSPVTLNIWNEPSQTVGDTTYLGSDAVGLQLSFASVRLLATQNLMCWKTLICPRALSGPLPAI